MQNYRFSRASEDGRVARVGGRGFTLVELMVTLAILAILVMLAAPSMRNMLIKRAVNSQAETLSAGLRLARSEAIKRGQRITICASTAPENTAPTCQGTGNTDWSTGWVIFVDHTSNLGAYDTGEIILKVQPGFAQSAGINYPRGAISFAPNGMSVGDNGTFTLLPNMAGTPAQNKDYIRCVVLTVSGRARTGAPDNSGACT